MVSGQGRPNWRQITKGDAKQCFEVRYDGQRLNFVFADLPLAILVIAYQNGDATVMSG